MHFGSMNVFFYSIVITDVFRANHMTFFRVVSARIRSYIVSG